MRSFEDSHGQHWQAALLDGSYGNIMLVFSPMQSGMIRRRALQVSTMAEAMAVLAGLDEDGRAGDVARGRSVGSRAWTAFEAQAGVA